MLQETGRIVAIDKDAVWVEAIRRSTCGSCAARSGCGQPLLARMSGQTSHIRVLLDKYSPSRYSVNQTVSFAIPNDIVVRGSALVYLLPLVVMLVFAGIAHTYFLQEGITMLSATIGFLAGGLWVYWHSKHHCNDRRRHPVIINTDMPAGVNTSKLEIYEEK